MIRRCCAPRSQGKFVATIRTMNVAFGRVTSDHSDPYAGSRSAQRIVSGSGHESQGLLRQIQSLIIRPAIKKRRAFLGARFRYYRKRLSAKISPWDWSGQLFRRHAQRFFDADSAGCTLPNRSDAAMRSGFESARSWSATARFRDRRVLCFPPDRMGQHVG